MRRSLKEIAEKINATLIGDADVMISSLASLATADSSQLSFYKDPRYLNNLQDTTAGAVILTESDQDKCNTNCLIVADPYQSFIALAEFLSQATHRKTGIHDSVVMGKDCQIAADVTIGPNTFIGDNVCIAQGVYIGPNCIIEDHCVIDEDCYFWGNVACYHSVQIAKRVMVHSGVVLGSDGFGNHRTATGWTKVPQLGTVRIGNDVEIGANTTIDRGALDDTIIEDGVKLDNLIQIAHNVRIGSHTVIAACVGIAGSAIIGKNCMIGGAACINGHIEVTDNVIITGMAMVTSAITKPGMYSSGTGLLPSREWRKNAVRFRHLDKEFRQIKRDLSER